MKLVRFLIPLFVFVSASALAAPPPKPKITMISFGDYLEEGKDYSGKEAIENAFQKLKDRGITTIYWRMIWEGAPDEEVEKYSYRTLAEIAQLRKQFEGTPYAWDPHELRWPIEVAHRMGMKLYAWIVPYNMGAPPGATAEYDVPPYPYKFPAATIYETQPVYYFRFLHEHPEYQPVDRAGKRYYYGAAEWAYPEMRAYWIRLIKLIVDKYDVDGLYMDTRTESMPPDYADQFGFNQPVVEEFQRRYGVNIRQEDFDLEKWRALRGEYFTIFLQEAAAVTHGKGKPFSFGTSRGDYLGYPLGNLKLEWRKWISEKIIDELQLDQHGWAWGPRQGYGYLTDLPTGRGLKPLDVAVREDYSPLCRKSGVKLYFGCHPYRPRPLSKPCCYSRATMVAPTPREGWCKDLAAMPEFDGTIE